MVPVAATPSTSQRFFAPRQLSASVAGTPNVSMFADGPQATNASMFADVPQAPANIPDPDTLRQQELSYAESLDERVKECKRALEKQLKQRADYLAAAGEQQKKQYALQVDQQVKSQEAALTKEHSDHLLMLQQAAAEQKLAMKRQATSMLLEYHHRKAEEELMQQRLQSQRLHSELQMQHREKVEELHVEQAVATQRVVEGQLECNQQIQQLQTQQAAISQRVAAQKAALAQLAVASSQHAHQAQQASALALQQNLGASRSRQAPTALYGPMPSTMSPAIPAPSVSTAMCMPQAVSFKKPAVVPSSPKEPDPPVVKL